jgi:hypothetical protein
MMRILGNSLFGLKLHDVFLPNHTIERDKFDILSVVRNIPAFINAYKYNILNQRFLELTGENKIISCISIEQLSDSIKTHGLGIISTTVNAFYRFLVAYLSYYIGKLQHSANFYSWRTSKPSSAGIENGSKNIVSRKNMQVIILMREPRISITRLKN